MCLPTSSSYIHTRTHTFTHVYVSMYDAVSNALAAAVLEFVYILCGSTSTLCVVCMRLYLVRERDTCTRDTVAFTLSLSLSRSNVRDRDEREREREMRVQACMCVHDAHTHRPF
jgi:hypothetical protein